MAIFPIKIKNSEINLSNDATETSFKVLGLKEANLEEFVRKNIGDLFADEDESFLIIGQQVIDSSGSRSDLIALDSEGNLVLIELKRDLLDLKSRSEALESQAIRYAASLASIKSAREIVEKMFSSYVQRHKAEFSSNKLFENLSESEIAHRVLNSFISQNIISSNINQKQRIILISSSFDDRTLASSAWLSRNGIDISCFELKPITIRDQNIIQFQKVLPMPEYFDFLPSIGDKAVSNLVEARQSRRKYLPRMDALIEWGLIKPSDKVTIRNYENSEATVVDQKFVNFNGEKMTFNEWGQSVTGWSSLCIYDWMYVNGSRKTLHQLRLEKMNDLSINSAG